MAVALYPLVESGTAAIIGGVDIGSVIEEYPHCIWEICANCVHERCVPSTISSIDVYTCHKKWHDEGVLHWAAEWADIRMLNLLRHTRLHGLKVVDKRADGYIAIEVA